MTDFLDQNTESITGTYCSKYFESFTDLYVFKSIFLFFLKKKHLQNIKVTNTGNHLFHFGD